MELLLSDKDSWKAPNFTPNLNHDWYLFPILMEDTTTGELWKTVSLVNFKLQLGVYHNGSMFSPPILSKLTSTYDSKNSRNEKRESKNGEKQDKTI